MDGLRCLGLTRMRPGVTGRIPGCDIRPCSRSQASRAKVWAAPAHWGDVQSTGPHAAATAGVHSTSAHPITSNRLPCRPIQPAPSHPIPYHPLPIRSRPIRPIRSHAIPSRPILFHLTPSHPYPSHLLPIPSHPTPPHSIPSRPVPSYRSSPPLGQEERWRCALT